MSDSDQEELPNNGRFDSESDLPGTSSVDSILAMGVIVSSPSANRHVRALDFGDSSTTGPAPNTGIPVGHVPLGGTGSSKGESFLDTSIHTPPQRKSPSPIPLHHGWSMGRGKEVGREGGAKSYTTVLQYFCWPVFQKTCMNIYIEVGTLENHHVMAG